MASSGSFTTTASQSRSLTFKWEIKSQSVADNKTTISWQVVGAGSASGYVIGGGIYVKINGTVVVDESTDTRYNIYNGTVVKSGTTTIAHNSDGTKTFSAEVKAGIYQYARNVSGSGSWTLTAIPRKATLSTATNFNDEGNPSITYSNPAGSAVSTLQAYIYASDDSTVLVGGKDLSKSGTSFTFSLTAAERNTLRNACTTSNSMTVKFYVKTIISGTTYWSSAINKTFSIINANPTSTTTVKDTNSAAIALTGNAATMIRGYNTISASMTATALKGATIKSYKITNGSTTKNSSSATFEATETPTFTFLATDSRGNTVSKTVTMPMVEYIKPTCGLSADMTVDGIVNATISGKCYNGSFGAASNKIVVQYRYKISGGNYGNWMDSVATFNNGGYNASVVISGLDYRSKYLIQARITDTISNQTSVEKTLSCIPVFDWSEKDFNFNVPVTVNGNKLFYEAGDTITFPNISAVWSGYVTSSTTELYLYIPLDKPVLAKGFTPSGTVMCRSVNGYINGTAWAASTAINLAKISSYTGVLYQISPSGLLIRLTNASAIANATNNTPVTATPYNEVTITFT